MNKKAQISIALLALSLIIVVIYSNIFHASWHFDDGPNILNNYFLHLDSISLEKLKNTLYTDVHNPYEPGKSLYRPVPCLTFALNWYFGQDNVFGYHLVDIVIHIMTAIFLFLFIINLFQTPNLKKRSYNNPILIALLASLLWAANPIQTQAVTYIVQRMAQLAALFYIMSMYAYIKGRLCKSLFTKCAWFTAAILIYPLAFYSKSNAAMLPAAIFLAEALFFQDLADKKVRRHFGFILIILVGLIVLFGSVVFFKGNPLSFLDTYETRTFTFPERVLAEPRVIILYLSQIFFPSPDRFSIAHDIVLSSSFIKPWTTIPCILIILSLIGFAIVRVKKWPLLSFAILFFFLNHIIESSIISLEIIFEHRNYLPSFFLFLPIAYVLEIFSTYRHKNRTISYSIVFTIIFVIICFSTSTFIRNKAWKNEITLWTDAVAKAPKNARALNILAIKLAWGTESGHPNRYDMALKLFEASLEKHISSKDSKADILGNMALIYFYNKQNHQRAISLFEEALKISPTKRKIRRDFADALIILKEFDSALQQTDILIDQDDENGIYYTLKGHILMLKKEYIKALSSFKKAYSKTPDKTISKFHILLNTAVALSLSGDHEGAEFLLLDLVKRNPGNIIIHLSLIEHSVRSKDNYYKTEIYVDQMFKQFDKREIRYALDTFTDNSKQAPLISKKLIAPVIEKKY